MNTIYMGFWIDKSLTIEYNKINGNQKQMNKIHYDFHKRNGCKCCTLPTNVTYSLIQCSKTLLNIIVACFLGVVKKGGYTYEKGIGISV